MARKNEALSLGEAIKEFLAQYKYSGKILESKIISAWPEVLGPNINAFTQNIYVKSGKLHVELSSPALRSELFLNRSRIVKSLNQFVGAEVITDIVFL